MKNKLYTAIATSPSYGDLSKRHKKLLHGSLFHKLDVIHRIDAGSLTKVEAAKELGCTPPAITKLMSSRASIQAFCRANPGAMVNKKAKIPKYQQLEEEVARWVESCNSLFSTIHFGLGMRMIQHYAGRVAKSLCITLIGSSGAGSDEDIVGTIKQNRHGENELRVLRGNNDGGGGLLGESDADGHN